MQVADVDSSTVCEWWRVVENIGGNNFFAKRHLKHAKLITINQTLFIIFIKNCEISLCCQFNHFNFVVHSFKKLRFSKNFKTVDRM